MKKVYICIILIAALVLSGCGPAIKAEQVKGFSFTIGGFGIMDTYEVIKSDLTVRRTKGNPSGEENTEVLAVWDEARWDSFTEQLIRCRVPQWSREYNDRLVYDGTQWSLTLSGDFKTIEIYGSNAYPGEWKDFMDLLHRYIDTDIR